MHTIPHMNGKSCKPFLELVSICNFSLIYTGKHDSTVKSHKDKAEKESKNNSDKKKNKRPEEEKSQLKHASALKTMAPHHSAFTHERFDALEEKVDEEAKSNKRVTFNQPTTNTKPEKVVTINQKAGQILAGDILLRIKHKGSFSNSLV